jgi:cystathionine beta-lyase/cystathionine gamma-synthase
MTPTDDLDFSTQALHPQSSAQFSAVPVYLTVTDQGRYTRSGNPTIDALEEQVALLEGGKYALATACGMAAVTQTLLALAGPGTRILCHRSVYDWADCFMEEEAPRLGFKVKRTDLRDLDGVKGLLKSASGENLQDIVYFEPHANPSLDVIDVQAVSELAHAAGALVVVDNTFLSPYLLRPLSLGADVVIHSLTKYMNGHGDVLGGAAVTNSESTIERLRRARNIYGGIISPMNAFLILRGMQTLPLRMDRHCASALQVAEFLSGHPQVSQVRYPGLSGDPGHDLDCRQLRTPGGRVAFGGMIGFQVRGSSGLARLEYSQRFGERLKLCKPWVSLGDGKTLVYVRDPEERKGVPEGYVRLSVGLEDPGDIIADLDQALAA